MIELYKATRPCYGVIENDPHIARFGFAPGLWLEHSVEEVEWSSVMELVIIVSTITSFFSHYMVEKGVVANAVSVLFATLITWMLTGDLAADFDTIFMRDIVITAVLALVVSIIVGLVFAHHKKCA